MGNWRRVHIDGTLDPAQVEAAHRACLYEWGKFDPASNLPHALSYSLQPSLCGLHEWPASRIKVVGNLYERDYCVESVVEALRIVLAAAPSLRAKVHCGADWESAECVATLTVSDQGVSSGPPEIDALPEISMNQMADRLFDALRHPRGHR